MHSQLSICLFLNDNTLAQSLVPHLGGDRYFVTQLTSKTDFLDFVDREKQQIDCLILQDSPDLPPLIDLLYNRTILLPAVAIKPAVHPTIDPSSEASSDNLAIAVEKQPPIGSRKPIYHEAVVELPDAQINQIPHAINQAIVQFLKLSPTLNLPNQKLPSDLVAELTTQNVLMLQQRRLTEKLKERLGYLGVYYKRDPKNFLRYLPPAEKQEFLERLKSEYRDILLIYFSGDELLNQKVDDLVNVAFFADVPVSQIVEIHMEVIDEFSKQLKLEGRSDEILLDYRLTLIDTIAHLCEMYRRSIPRES